MKTRHAEEQIIGILNEAQARMPVADLLRKHNISLGIFYHWKAKCGYDTQVRDAGFRNCRAGRI